MKNQIQHITAITSVKQSLNRSLRRHGLLLIPLMFAVACLSLSPQASATCQDGCLSNGDTRLGDNTLLNDLGQENTAIGDYALESNNSGIENTAVGDAPLSLNTSGSYNVAVGEFALFYNSTGSGNTATGNFALSSETTATNNTADGISALQYNTTGSDNTANGAGALYGNTTASGNTANGFEALHGNTTGYSNTASGAYALYANTTSSFSTATGYEALVSSTGGSNTANGYLALFSDTSGSGNTAFGTDTLYSNTTGSNNIALGYAAGFSLTTGTYNIDIGNLGAAGESKHIRIGTNGIQTHTFIAGISGATVAGGVGVVVDSSGHLGTSTSSARFKDDIKPMDEASEAILALKPVTFRYKKELDPKAIPQFGLVAEQVEKVNPDLVARDDKGKPFSVRYEAVNAMLLNEFLKAHHTVEQLKTTIAQQKKEFDRTIVQQQREIETLAATVREQAALIQKVSAQMSMTRPAPRLVVDNQ